MEHIPPESHPLQNSAAKRARRVLAGIGMPLAELAHRRGQEEELHRSLRQIRDALDAYKHLVDIGRIASPAGGSGRSTTGSMAAAMSSRRLAYRR